MKLKVVLTFCAVIAGVTCSYHHPTSEKRNIVVIMSDDHAFNDVSFRGSDEIPTPNIDALAYSGTIMDRFYTPPICTPSRASFLTGKNYYKLGLQNGVPYNDEPWGLAKNEKILPQYLKESGYATHLVGKWHVGSYQKQYMPTNRGFDTFLGHTGPYLDYFNYKYVDFAKRYSIGFDMRRNLEVANDFDPIYATDLFTNEAVKVIENHNKSTPLFLFLSHLAPHAGNDYALLQAPEEEIAKFSYIKDVNRRTLAAMISSLDKSVGNVVKSLKDNNLLDNTIIVFFSDNGGLTLGPHSTTASNYPLRGQKQSGWEGSIRNNAIIYAPFLLGKGEIRTQLMYVTDLLPTLLGQAGVDLSSSVGIDGVDQWDVINFDDHQVRRELINVDDVAGFGTLIFKYYKLVNGSFANGTYDGWLSPDNKIANGDPNSYASKVLNSLVAQALLSVQGSEQLTAEKILKIRKAATVTCSSSGNKNTCDPRVAPCLFDIFDDPCEENNLASTRPGYLKDMLQRYNRLRREAVASRKKPTDPASDPKNFNFNWQWFQEDS